MFDLDPVHVREQIIEDLKGEIDAKVIAKYESYKQSIQDQLSNFDDLHNKITQIEEIIAGLTQSDQQG